MALAVSLWFCLCHSGPGSVTVALSVSLWPCLCHSGPVSVTLALFHSLWLPYAICGSPSKAIVCAGILPTPPPKLGKGRIANQHVTGMSVSQVQPER